MKYIKAFFYWAIIGWWLWPLGKLKDLCLVLLGAGWLWGGPIYFYKRDLIKKVNKLRKKASKLQKQGRCMVHDESIIYLPNHVNIEIDFHDCFGKYFCNKFADIVIKYMVIPNKGHVSHFRGRLYSAPSDGWTTQISLPKDKANKMLKELKYDKDTGDLLGEEDLHVSISRTYTRKTMYYCENHNY